MATLRTNLPDLFLSRLANLTDVLINEYEVEDQISEKILKVRDMGNRPFVTTTTVGTFGTVPIKVEGADVAYDEMGMGFDKTYTADTYELAFRTSKEALDDEQEESVSDAGRALGRSGRYTVEADCANIFNLGFSVTTGAPDGVVLFSTSHPLVGGGTQANRPSTDADLSTSALRSALNDIADTVDDGGLLIHWRPNVLLVPYELKWQADELMNSVDRSDTSDRAKNTLKSEGIQVIAWPYLTDADAWFLLDTSSLNIRKYWRERMNLLHDWDFESSGMKVKTRFRFVRGWSDFRGAYGTSGG